MSDPRPAGGDARPADGGRQRDATYWLSRPPAERLAEIERLRRERYGEGYDDLRIELVATIIRPGHETRVIDLGRRRGEDAP